MNRSAASAARRPSLYLSLVFLALGISAALALGTPEEASDEHIASLLQNGWVTVDQPPCEGLKAPGFYELESENESVELYFLGPDRVLVSRPPPWPEGTLQCRPIPKPSFVKEI